MAVPRRVYQRLPHRFPREYRWSRRSIEYNGVNQYVEVAESPSMSSPDTTDAVTLEIWFRLLAIPPLVGWSSPARKTNDYELVFNPYPTVQIWMGIAGVRILALTYVLPVGLALNRWYHMGFTYDGAVAGGTVILYINGVNVASAAAVGANMLQAAPSFLRVNDNQVLNFRSDEARVLNRALTPYEMLESFHRGYAKVEAGCVMALRMEEGSGLTAYDDSGFGNNGSLLPAISPPTWRENQLYELLAEAEV